MLRLLRLLALMLLAWPVGVYAQAAVVTTDQVRAELVANAPEGVTPGKPLWLGLLIKHRPHWHTYWKNAGDSGLPTTLAWDLPPGVAAGDILWPTPQRLPIGPLVNYGYENTLLLPVPVTVGEDYKGQALDVKLRADWLVCKEVCIPESGEFRLRIPAQASTVGQAELFQAALSAQPQPAPGANVQAKVEGAALAIDAQGLPAGLQGKTLQFFAEDAGVIDHAAVPEQRWDGARLQLRVPLSAQRFESPAVMQAVLKAPDLPAGVQIRFEVSGGWPPIVAVAPVAAANPALPPGADPAPRLLPGAGAGGGSAASTAGGTSPGIWAALGLAFLGGLLLNLMPCVFPILSLKVLGFARHAGDRRQLAAGGIAYALGVVLSFVALAGLLLALRGGGEQLGWGFQLQSPQFVALLALLFTLIGLNLSGVFEFGNALPGNLGALRLRHPLADHALTGVLAVAVASPCTAPFMGAALGAALGLPAAQALAVFAALGAGMAAPYLLASLWPGFARLLPRPGPWMARFKSLMAFPMYATVVWLVWVLGQQVGIDGAAALLGVLVAVAFVAWAFGTPGFGKLARGAFGGLALLLLGASVSWAWPALRSGDAGPAQAARGAAAQGWQPWSPQAVALAQQQGRPVFVDFTAAWCVTCQFNKRTTLADAEVLADFAAKRVLLLRADWTRRDAAITQQLAAFGRNGVPVYAVYQPGGGEPQLLSELLSVGEVRQALAGL